MTQRYAARIAIEYAMKLGRRWIHEIERSDEPESWIPVVNEIASGSCCKYKRVTL
jgi:hypothetical protein